MSAEPPVVAPEASVAPGIWPALARAALRATGWTLVGRAPDVPRCVIIFAPHTSSWDFPLLIAVRSAFGREVSYLIKESLVRFPLATPLRWSGAIPVERSRSHDLVSRLAALFREREQLWLALSPEGTRAWTDHWRSGFYYLALEAGVPIVPAFIDAGRKQCGLGPAFTPSGDVERDMQTLAEFYADKPGIVPGRAGVVRLLREPDED